MIINPDRPFEIGHKVSGEARCILYDENMKPIYDSGWDKNVICNQGLDLLHTDSNPTAYTYVGDGTGAVLETNSAMSNLIGYTSVTGTGNDVFVQPVTPNWEFSRTKSRRFGAGVGSGTIREVGMGGNTSGTELVCRQLLGTPITKVATQSLDVIWRWTIWPPTYIDTDDDILGVIDIGGIAYNYKLRPRQLAIAKSGSFPPGSGVFGQWTRTSQTDAFWGAWNGDIGDAFTSTVPSGTYASGFGTFPATVGSYGSGQRYVLITKTGGLTAYNITSGGTGIRSLTASSTIGLWQCQFNAVSGGGRIPKTGSNEIETVWKFSWDRKV